MSDEALKYLSKYTVIHFYLSMYMYYLIRRELADLFFYCYIYNPY